MAQPLLISIVLFYRVEWNYHVLIFREFVVCFVLVARCCADSGLDGILRPSRFRMHPLSLALSLALRSRLGPGRIVFGDVEFLELFPGGDCLCTRRPLARCEE